MLRNPSLFNRCLIVHLVLTLLFTNMIFAQWTTDNNVSWGGTTYDILFPSNQDRTVSIGGPYALQYKFSVREDDKQFAVFENQGTAAVPVFVVDQSKVGLGDLPFSATTASALNIDDKLHIFGRARIQDSDPYLNFEFSDATGGKAGFRFLNQNAGFTTTPFASILIDQNTDDLTFDMPEDIHFDFLSSTMTLDGFALETSVLQTRWKTSTGDNRARLSFGFGNMMQFGNDIDADVQFVQNGNPIITLDTENNVGVGQTEPLSRLHVNGDMRIEDGNGNLDFYNTTGENLGYIRARADHTGVGHLDSADVRIATNGKFRFYVKGNGSVGVGRMTPEQKLDVNGAIKLDDTNNEVAGSIRYRGTDFEGYDGTEWKSLQNTWEDGSIGNNIFYNDGQVSIGTEDANRTLTVGGSIAVKDDDGGVTFFEEGSSIVQGSVRASAFSFQMIANGNRDLEFNTNGQKRMSINTEGDIGIGTTTPDQKLDVEGAIKIGTTIEDIPGSIRYEDNDFEGYDGTEWKSLTGSGSGASWSENAVGDVFTLDRVGIGTHTVGSQLTIAGSMSFKNASTIIGFGEANGPVQYSRIIADSLDLELITFDQRPIKFFTNNLPRMTIADNGNVIIGGVPDIPQKLNVDGAILIGNTSLNAEGSIRYDGSDFEGFDGTEWKSLTDSGGSGSGPWSTNGVGEIYFNGGTNVGIGTNDPVAALHVEGLIAVSGGMIHPSDIRLKRNIAPIEDALEIIKQLEPKTYDFKNELIEEMGLSERKQYGLIAQDVEEILPEIVHSELALNANNDEEYKAIDYDQILPILIEAIKDLEKQVQELKAERSK